MPKRAVARTDGDPAERRSVELRGHLGTGLEDAEHPSGLDVAWSEGEQLLGRDGAALLGHDGARLTAARGTNDHVQPGYVEDGYFETGEPDAAEEPTSPDPIRAHPTSWTGSPSVRALAQTVRTLVAPCLEAIDVAVAALETPGGNGGPANEERDAAIATLRELHGTLDRLIRAVDSGDWVDLHEGLAADAVKLCRRVAAQVAHDPATVALMLVVEGIGLALGVPGASTLATLAWSARKPRRP